jgi:hypothetical protein
VAVERDGAAGDVIHLSVVVPAYNEEQRITPTLERLRAYLAAQPYSSEIVVVDDGSRDQTTQVARAALAGAQAGQTIRYTPNRGKGFAVRTGVLATTGRYVLFTDADLSTPIESWSGRSHYSSPTTTSSSARARSVGSRSTSRSTAGWPRGCST